MTSYSNTNSLTLNGIIHSIIQDTEDYLEFYITREYQNQAGESVVDWYTVQATNGQAEKVRSYGTGTYVLITGEFFNKKVPGTDKEGNPTEWDSLIIKAHKVIVVAEDEPVNHGVITGQISKFNDDPKVTRYETGDRVRITVAYNSRRKNEATGEWEDLAQYFTVTLWWNAGKGDSFRYDVGDYVCLGVSVKCNQWKDETTGDLRVATQIQCNRLDAKRTPKKQRDEHGSYTPPALTSAPKSFAKPKVKDPVALEQIPF